MVEMDELDVKILSLLQENGRQSFRDIAKYTHSSVPTVASRVDRMQQLGIIKRFTIEIDREKIVGVHTALLMIDVKPSDTSSIVSELVSMDGVMEICTSLDSDFGIIAKVVGNTDDVIRIQNQLTHPGVNRVRAIFIKQTIERDALNLPTSLIKMSCSYCGKEISQGTIRNKIGDRNYYFCCNTCKSAFMDKYQDLKKKA